MIIFVLMLNAYFTYYMTFLKVIPAMALVIAYLGEKLHKISKEANLSAAALAAYLNEVYLR